MPEKWVLRQLQALPLIAKVRKSQLRIREWYEHFDGNVCVSFSGGKDSTVLAHLVHELYPEVPLVFANTGLEYPEVQSFARKMGAEFVRPKLRFDEVISKHGYPIISKEVAEAIYYARRIRSKQDDPADNARDAVPHGEKTAEYYKRMVTGKPGISKDGTILTGGGRGTKETEFRRKQLNCRRQKIAGTLSKLTQISSGTSLLDGTLGNAMGGVQARTVYRGKLKRVFTIKKSGSRCAKKRNSTYRTNAVRVLKSPLCWRISAGQKECP